MIMWRYPERGSTDPPAAPTGSADDDARSQALFREALREPTTYKRVEWWDPDGAPLPHPNVAYPALDEPAAFLCANGACSPPITDPGQIRPASDALARRLGWR